MVGFSVYYYVVGLLYARQARGIIKKYVYAVGLYTGASAACVRANATVFENQRSDLKIFSIVLVRSCLRYEK